MSRRIFSLVVIFALVEVVLGARNTKMGFREIQQEENVRKYNQYYVEAMCQKAVGNQAASYELLTQALHYQPKAAETIFELAQLMSQNPLYSEEEVKQWYELAYAYDSLNVDYCWQLAQYDAMIDHLDEATVLLQKLTHNVQKRHEAYSMLAIVYERQGKDTLLLNTLNQWEQEEGQDENISLEKYKVLRELGRYTEAMSLLDTLCTTYVQNDYYPILKAECYLTMGDTLKAMEQKDWTEKHFPGTMYAQQFMVQYYQQLGKEKQLTEEIEKVILNIKQDMGTRVNYLQSYLNSNKEESKKDSLFQLLLQEKMESADLMNVYLAYQSKNKAPDSVYVPILEKILEVDPTDASNRLRLTWYLFKQQEYEKTIRCCEEGVKYDPKQLLLYLMGGNSSIILKNTEKANYFFQAGLSCVSVYHEKDVVSDFYSAYGDLLHEMNQCKESYAMYDSALVYNPSNVPTLNNYAYYLALENENLDKALQMASLAVKYSPDEATYLDTYAWVYFMKGDYENARIYIDKALACLKGTQTDASVYEHSGDIYSKQGKMVEAVTDWKKAKKLGVDSQTIEKKIKLQKYIEE